MIKVVVEMDNCVLSRLWVQQTPTAQNNPNETSLDEPQLNDRKSKQRRKNEKWYFFCTRTYTFVRINGVGGDGRLLLQLESWLIDADMHGRRRSMTQTRLSSAGREPRMLQRLAGSLGQPCAVLSMLSLIRKSLPASATPAPDIPPLRIASIRKVAVNSSPGELVPKD